MDESAVGPAEILRAVGNDSRLRILGLLQGHELCVCELVDAVGRPHYAVSRDLAALQNAGLILERREGSWVYHSIAPLAESDPFLGGLLRLIESRVAHVPAARADRERLARRLALRVEDRCVVGVGDFVSKSAVCLEPFSGGLDGERRDF